MLEPPTPCFNADPEAKYTYIVVDFGAKEREDLRYIHFMKSNIEGDDPTTGDVILGYVPSFTFYETDEGELDDDPTLFNEHGHFIYRQTEDIPVDEEQLKCNANLLSPPRYGTPV